MRELQKVFTGAVCGFLLLGCGMAVGRSQQAAAGKLRAELLRPKSVEPVGAEEFRQILAAHRGEVVLVNLWATWCRPCVREIPELVKLQQKHQEQKFTVIAVSFDDIEDLNPKVRDFARQNMPDFIHYLQKDDDPEQFVRVMDAEWEGVVPTNFLLDREGKLRAKLIGGKTYEDFAAALKPLLTPAASGQ